MARGLPFGRGYDKDKVGRLQEFERRSRENPKTGGWYVSSIGLGGFVTPMQNAKPHQNAFYILPMAPLYEDHTVVQASVYASAGGTGSDLKCALFVYDRDRRMVQVPGTKVSFDTDTTGHIDVNLLEPVTLLAGSRYFFGFYNSVATTSADVVTTLGRYPIEFATSY